MLRKVVTMFARMCVYVSVCLFILCTEEQKKKSFKKRLVKMA